MTAGPTIIHGQRRESWSKQGEKQKSQSGDFCISKIHNNVHSLFLFHSLDYFLRHPAFHIFWSQTYLHSWRSSAAFQLGSLGLMTYVFLDSFLPSTTWVTMPLEAVMKIKPNRVHEVRFPTCPLSCLSVHRALRQALVNCAPRGL